MNTLINNLYVEIEKQGWKGQIIPAGHLEDLRESIQSRYNKGFIDEKLYQDQLSFFSFDLPADLPNAQSILIIAVPTSQMRIFFHWQDNQIPVVIPPTYVSYSHRTRQVQKFLESWLLKSGYHMSGTKLPLKTLAVQSGLATYGRNNICYVDGMGSFLQLVGAFTDLSCGSDSWLQPKMLDRCDKCYACLRHCPTGAIVKDRFLLHAELCLTYHNESTRDFADWIDPSWHHSLVGCMRCQRVCPENRNVLNWYEDRVEFSEEETQLFLQCKPFDQLPDETREKYNSLEINENFNSICRNLSMLIHKKTDTN